MITDRIARKVKRKLKSLLQRAHRKYIGFTPYYNRRVALNPQEPEVYNQNGEKINVFFLSDREFAHNPYGGITRPMRYGAHHILWDRYNFGLKTHFYSHYEAFLTVGNPDRRYAFLNESRAITPASYEKYIANRSYIENEFDAVFTFDDEILSNFKNAKLVPYSAAWFCR